MAQPNNHPISCRHHHCSICRIFLPVIRSLHLSCLHRGLCLRTQHTLLPSWLPCELHCFAFAVAQGELRRQQQQQSAHGADSSPSGAAPSSSPGGKADSPDSVSTMEKQHATSHDLNLQSLPSQPHRPWCLTLTIPRATAELRCTGLVVHHQPLILMLLANKSCLWTNLLLCLLLPCLPSSFATYP